MIRQRIEQAVKEALVALGAGEASFVVERPAHIAHGDYATNAALAAAKLLKKNPREVAGALAKALEGKIEEVEKLEVAGAGFINFWLSRGALARAAEAAVAGNLDANDLHVRKTVLVEYTDPNPFKEFHIGHLMSNAIGESIARLLERSGAKVVRANYQGDVGPHVAKAIWGKMQKPDASWGEAYVYGVEQYEAQKADIDAINKKVYEYGDEEVNALYDAGRKESLAHFEEIYGKLGTKFDHYFFESETGPKGLALINAHKDIFEESEGAVVFRGKHTRVFITSQGLPTYEAKELGLAQLKQEKAPSDLYITITASEQTGFFEVVFEVIEKIFPALRGKYTHRSHGMMRFASGKMSSRKGNVITGESLLQDLEVAAREKMSGRELKDAEKVAEQVAVGAVKYAVLRQGSGRDIVFDPEKSLSLEGDSGPYLQYARVRAASLLRKMAEAQEVDYRETEYDQDFQQFGLWFQMMRILVHFPDVMHRAAQEMEPHYLTTYLSEVASTFNSWYGTERIIVDGKVGNGVPAVVKAVEQVLATGLNALGIPAPEEM